MTNERLYPALSEFMRFLAKENGDGERLPALTSLSQHLGVSVASLREQLEVARALGLVEVRPKTGIRRLPYRFAPAVLNSLSYATAINSTYFFKAFSDFRNHIEAAYWHQAVELLTEEDHAHLKDLVNCAFQKLDGSPIQIPHYEHRELHLSIYCHLKNPFVLGILEAYWEAYEAVGLNVYTDISYLKKVWDYHQKMVEAICCGQAEEGFKALIEHTDLLLERS
ncbi:MAG: FadR family transcriptional regulator [Anaerolineaceae bacterium]|nr:FadR family transcriptional regulator [Anaerolineaceae bacterium]